MRNFYLFVQNIYSKSPCLGTKLKWGVREGEKEGHEYDQDSVTLRNLQTRSIWRQAIVIQCTGSKCLAKVMAKNTGAETLETGVTGIGTQYKGGRVLLLLITVYLNLYAEGRLGHWRVQNSFLNLQLGYTIMQYICGRTVIDHTCLPNKIWILYLKEHHCNFQN